MSFNEEKEIVTRRRQSSVGRNGQALGTVDYNRTVVPLSSPLSGSSSCRSFGGGASSFHGPLSEKKKLRFQNAHQWGTIAAKLDAISLIICTLLVFLLPGLLFGPLAFSEHCSQNFDE